MSGESALTAMAEASFYSVADNPKRRLRLIKKSSPIAIGWRAALRLEDSKFLL